MSHRAIIVISATAAVLFAALAILQGCSGDEQEPGLAPPSGFFGVVPQGSLSEEEFARMAEGGIATIRIVVPWAVVDPTSEDDAYDWSSTDAVVTGAAREGIEVVPTLFGTPAWVANELDGAECTEGDCAIFAPRSAKALGAWRDFVAAAVRRYGPGGELWSASPEIEPRPVRAWQIWNEQNSPTFYMPKPDVHGYERLLAAAAAEIRAGDSGAKIVLGGMFGTPFQGEPPGETAWGFLRKLYEIPGATDDFDGVGAHPYAAGLRKVEYQVARLHDQIVRADDEETSIWITEVGWASAGPDVPLNRGVEGQARELTDAFNLFLDKRLAWNIELVTWYAWRDTTEPICEWCRDAGLFTVDFEPKPSWSAFLAFTGGS